MKTAPEQRSFPKKTAIIATVVAVLFVGASFARFVYEKQPTLSNKPLEHITTGNVGEYSTLSIIAKQKGFFAKNGLDVSMQDYLSGPDAMADLLAGKIDTATASDFVGVSNSFSGEDLKILTTQMRAFSFFL